MNYLTNLNDTIMFNIIIFFQCLNFYINYYIFFLYPKIKNVFKLF